MKLLLAFATAGLLGTASAQAQTVLPSGAVAPTGAIVEPSGVLVTPAAVPGSQPLNTPSVRDGGSPRAARHDVKVPGMDHQERKQMRKMGKMKYDSNSSKQSGKN
ncbi:MAG: hypothetical protein ACRYFX_12625 [Janthinobacterium lividum]